MINSTPKMESPGSHCTYIWTRFGSKEASVQEERSGVRTSGPFCNLRAFRGRGVLCLPGEIASRCKLPLLCLSTRVLIRYAKTRHLRAIDDSKAVTPDSWEHYQPMSSLLRPKDSIRKGLSLQRVTRLSLSRARSSGS